MCFFKWWVSNFAKVAKYWAHCKWRCQEYQGELYQLYFLVLDIRFFSQLLGLNVDSASVNMRVHQGLGKLVRDSGPWLSLVCCFNHWVKLTIKHSFVNSSFEEISKLLTELYFLYQKSLKRHQNISRSIGKNCLDYIA